MKKVLLKSFTLIVSFLYLVPFHPAMCQSVGADVQHNRFEVASIKPAECSGVTLGITSQQIRIANASLSQLISMANGISEERILNKPSWMTSQCHTVLASLGTETTEVTEECGSASLTLKNVKAPLQTLIKDRFGLVAHNDQRMEHGYALVIAAGGTKLHAATDFTSHPVPSATGLKNPSLTMKSLATALSGFVGKPVLDQTGLTGVYDVNLSFSKSDAIESDLPSVFTAVQEQLGLKLVSHDVPTDVLVIDHVERQPTDN